MLTYHRAKSERENNICPDCKKLQREAERTCYWCRESYSDARGMSSGQSEAWAAMRQFARASQSMSEDEKAVAQEQLTQCRPGFRLP